MIPASFTYHRPTSVPQAVALLAELGDEARPLAGGHSLIPMMKLRLALPTHLVDLAAVSDLRGLRQQGGEITIGAMTTQHELIGSELIATTLPILRETALVIADPQVRYLGTLGGNVANGDPGNDMPAVMMCLNASYRVAGKGGERRIAAREFYHGAYFTALEPGEIITAIDVPRPAARHGYAYEKLKRKVGDYATAAAAVMLGASASCAPGGTTATPPGRTPGTAVVVASFNFPESELVAATYALALMNAGIPARLRPGLGPREFVQQALAEGVVDVVPEYLGSALTGLEPVIGVAMSDQAAVRRELARALARRQVQVLQPAAAQDQNGLMVTRATAARLRLRKVSDLAPIAPGMVVGGRPECLRRPYCLPGLHRLYGLEFARFVPLASEHDRIDAIDQGVVDPKLKVHGVNNLRVVDASVFPIIPDCRIQNTVYMVGEKGADLVKADHKDLYK